MKSLAQEFCAALEHYALCLHPTDSLPGLTFNPHKMSSLEYLLAFKGRQAEKSFIGLVRDFATARRYFKPLPSHWDAVLQALWPAPLSVIWQAAEPCPSPLKAADGTVALRVPRLRAQDQWLLNVLETIDFPLPTTSVNYSGQPPLKTWSEAVNLLANDPKIFIPKIHIDAANHLPSAVVAGRPSTLLKIHEDGTFAILRAGLVDEQEIRAQIDARDNHEK